MLQPFPLGSPTNAALDPFGWVVLAIILLNLLSPLFRRRRSVTPPNVAPSDEASQPGTPQLSTLQSSTSQTIGAQTVAPQQRQAARRAVTASTLTRSAPAAGQISALSDEDKARLRQALAQGGVSALTAELQRRQGQATTSVSTDTPKAAPLTVSATFNAAFAAPAGPAAMGRPASAYTAASLSAAAYSPASLPPPSLPPPPTSDGLSLMTLESGVTAFNQLPPGKQQAAGLTGDVRMFAVLNSPRAVAAAFVASAIIGPCAALRPLGHTPAGW